MCLLFGFCGTGYYGLQSQRAEGTPDQPTISDALRSALLASGAIAPTNFAPLSRTKWTLASRTDKGVHAAGAAVSFKMETLEEQRQKGRQKFTVDQHGNKTIERVVGICPRTAGELSRSFKRWGQFLGLQDTPAEVTQHTLIQLSAPSDGAAFGEKWSQQPVEIEATGPAIGPTAQLPPAEASQSLSEALLSKQFEANQGAA